MRNYVGPLLDSLEPDEITEEGTVECDGSWMHYGARADTIVAICLGQRVKLTRMKMLPTATETPGVVEGFCYGSSSQANGRILLAIEGDDGESVAVDVSNPRDWAWEVH